MKLITWGKVAYCLAYGRQFRAVWQAIVCQRLRHVRPLTVERIDRIPWVVWRGADAKPE